MRRATVLMIAVVIGAGAGGMVLGTRQARPPEIAPAGVLRQPHGLSAENRPVIRLDPTKVPAELRDLIPLAERWGVGDDIIRSELVNQATAEQKRALFDAVSPRYGRINAWLDTFDPNSQAMSDEMAAFMYLAEASEEAVGALENP